jgi:hypothetical protein
MWLSMLDWYRKSVCANWSARDLRSANDHARARSCIFKASVQPSFIRTLDRIIYHRFDHFEALIIYITLHHKKSVSPIYSELHYTLLRGNKKWPMFAKIG